MQLLFKLNLQRVLLLGWFLFFHFFIYSYSYGLILPEQNAAGGHGPLLIALAMCNGCPLPGVCCAHSRAKDFFGPSAPQQDVAATCGQTNRQPLKSTKCISESPFYFYLLLFFYFYVPLQLSLPRRTIRGPKANALLCLFQMCLK